MHRDPVWLPGDWLSGPPPSWRTRLRTIRFAAVWLAALVGLVAVGFVAGAVVGVWL